MGLLVPSPGRPLEVCGNAHPRWMAVATGHETAGRTEPGVSAGPFTPCDAPPPESTVEPGQRGRCARVALARRPNATGYASGVAIAAIAAAPRIPELLRWTAGTAGVLRFSSGMKSSAFLETPPPMMNRSGEKSRSSVA